MPFRRPKIRIRTLMAGVAVIALVSGSTLEYARLSRLAGVYRSKSEDHAGIEATLRRIIAATGPDSPIDISPGEGIRSRRFPAAAVLDLQAAMKRKYDRAARYPWMIVGPDPMSGRTRYADGLTTTPAR